MPARYFLELAIVSMIVSLAAVPVPGQEQTGIIEGILRDQQGGVLPGATIAAKNLAVGSLLSMVSDSAGSYRFPALAPGLYDISAVLSGFQTVKFEQVEILLGQVKRLDFTLQVAGPVENVVVAGTSPLVDSRQSACGFSMRFAELQLLPRSLDYTTVAQQLPGTNAEPKLGGLSFDGSSASENRFIIDGIDTTDMMKGLPGQGLNIDSVEEIQVKSSGYAAEFGGATGGVLNVLTRSGTNRWHGDVRFYFSGSVLDSGPRPTLRRNLQDASKAEYITYPEDPYRSLEPGFSLGGPIRSDKAWFFVSYQPLFRHTERTVTFALDGSRGTFAEDLRQHFLTVSQTLQFGSRLRTRAAFSMVRSLTDGLLPSKAGSDNPVANFDVTTYQPNRTGSFSADYIPTPQTWISGRIGYYFYDNPNENVRSGPIFTFGRPNLGFLDVPVSLQRVLGFRTDSGNAEALKDRRTRLSTQVDATWFLRGWGEHAFKGGVQADWSVNDADVGQKGNIVGLQWDREVLGQRGRYGYYTLLSNPLDPKRGQTFIGRAAGSTAGFFFQDAWTIRRRLTLNVGLRSERETVPEYVLPGAKANPIIRFRFSQKIAPRLGAAYDLNGDGRWKLYGSWGIFYDIFKYSLSTAFGGLRSTTYAFTLDTYDWPSLLSNPACPPACPGRLIFGPRNNVNTDKNAIDPDLSPVKLQEAAIGIEHQVRPSLLLTARYIHKQLDRAVEDIGSLGENFSEIYTVGNPGFGRATLAFPGVPLPKAVRRYDAFEVAIRRPFRAHWTFAASYLWSRLYGNFSGLSQSDENGRTDPYVGRAYDHGVIMFDEKGKPVYGRLATDRPHQFKGQLIYTTRFGLNAGIFQAVASGIPVTREARVLPPSYYPIQYRGRMSDGRTPLLSQTDLYLQQDIHRMRETKLAVGLSIGNLFNQDAVINRYVIETEQGLGLSFTEADFYAGRLDFQQLAIQQKITADPRFMMPLGYQPPRTIRLTLKWLF